MSKPYQNTMEFALMSVIKDLSHILHFLGACVRSPRKMGTLLPSSRTVARAMVRYVDTARPGVVLELGAGTGVITQALLQAGVPPEQLVVLELDKRLHGRLSKDFPQLHVLCANALHIKQVLSDRGASGVNAIVSALPLLSMPPSLRRGIEHEMLSLIDEQGVLVQITHGFVSPIHKESLLQHKMSSERKVVMGNVPPAHLWVYRKSTGQTL